MEKLQLYVECDCSGHPYNYYIANKGKGFSITELRAYLLDLGYSSELITQMIVEAEEVY